MFAYAEDKFTGVTFFYCQSAKSLIDQYYPFTTRDHYLQVFWIVGISFIFIDHLEYIIAMV